MLIAALKRQITFLSLSNFTRARVVESDCPCNRYWMPKARLAREKVVEKLNEFERELFKVQAMDKGIADPEVGEQYAANMRQTLDHIGSARRVLEALFRVDYLTSP